jgi:4-alpha-glucanotransferase
MTDLAPFAGWMAEAGFDRLLLLPLGTMHHGQTSPYAATSTLSIDPIYLDIDATPDFRRAGGVGALSAASRAAVVQARRSPVVDYEAVRIAKTEALALAFARFLIDEWNVGSERARDLALYIDRERWWLDDYALHHALSRLHDFAPWTAWEPEWRDRHPRRLEALDERLEQLTLAEKYAQWLAEGQWQEARHAARQAGVALYGDLPFVAGTDSSEVWAQPQDFLLDVSTGVPPDAFSEIGQDWGLPTYRWDAIRANGYRWLRLRARRMAGLFDGLRVDHTIGLYRTYGRPQVGEPFFTPSDEPTQIEQGAEILGLLSGSGLDLIAEDLGLVPDFLEPSLAALDIPGCKVLRWERAWKSPGAPFVDPATFPARSAAMTGTHDTEPLAAWWEELPLADRGTLLALPLFEARGFTDPAVDWSDDLRDLLLELAYGAGSRHLFFPIQDLFGWSDRINLPGSVGPHNWTWVLPWPVDRIGERPEIARHGRLLASLAAAYRRGGLH